ncbi:hypothetical protein GYMLUDRAFT_241627 [Collybiopsis luxurians FD-317 M1]|uniref:Uncharacterized protein n=1 Tax=Collybiopsis luxurians FD-317 M1 TaxID=944289 RepID=A0A0D0D380_9AGAR|nr:hypothetical protein GYMLUDRAFT_241627 [Collybiopsis luxurians FD-317 M1]
MPFAKISNLVALLLFTSLAVLAVNFILVHGQVSGFFAGLNAQCPSLSLGDTTPYRLFYTGIHSIDETLCGIVAMFHSSFDPSVSQFLTYFLISGLPVMAHVYLESYRPNKPIVLALPVIFVQAMQFLSFGVTFSVYWMLFVVSGAAQSAPLGRQSMITIAHAQAVLFGIFISIILTGCLMVLQDPYITAIWQVFPAVVSIASLLHLFIRPASRYPDSGFSVIRGSYIASFIVISSLHISILTSNSLDELKSLFLPSIHVLPSSAPLERHSLNLLQWDAVFGFSSSLLGTLWFGRNTKEIVALFAWSIFGSVLAGPGAAFAASALWRESCLHAGTKNGKSE